MYIQGSFQAHFTDHSTVSTAREVWKKKDTVKRWIMGLSYSAFDNSLGVSDHEEALHSAVPREERGFAEGKRQQGFSACPSSGG